MLGRCDASLQTEKRDVGKQIMLVGKEYATDYYDRIFDKTGSNDDSKNEMSTWLKICTQKQNIKLS